MASRILGSNYVQLSAAVISASSEEASAPATRLIDQMPSRTWRSRTGWTIVAGFNDKIDFVRSGTKVATLTPGTYATGDALALAVIAALESADSTPVWACSYDGPGAGFRISSDIAFQLLWSSGTNAWKSCGKELGFIKADDSVAPADTGSSVGPFVAAYPTYQSRHFILSIIPAISSPPEVIQDCVVAGGNFSGIKCVVQGNDDTDWSPGGINWSQALVETSEPYGQGIIQSAMTAIVGAASAYVRVVFNACPNPDGHTECGVWYLGNHVIPTFNWSVGMSLAWEELSKVSTAISGAHWQDERPRRPVWRLQWSEIPEAARADLAALWAVLPAGRCFFVAFDTTVDPSDIAYVYLAEGIAEVLANNIYHDVSVPALSGVLGW
jgi:hypothetical protein